MLPSRQGHGLDVRSDLQKHQLYAILVSIGHANMDGKGSLYSGRRAESKLMVFGCEGTELARSCDRVCMDVRERPRV